MSRRASALFRTTLASVFVLFMLASAHLLMAVINRVETAVEAPRPEAGMDAKIFSDRPLAEEIQGALNKANKPQDIAALEVALARVEAGEPIELKTLPVTPFLGYTALGLTLMGCFLIWLTSRMKSDASQSIVGIFGGNLIWTGGIEYGLTWASRSLGIGKTVAVVDGQIVAIYGEYVLLKHTWGAMALIIAYIWFLESSRCPIFLWWRKYVPTMRGEVATGKIDNYGPRTAFQYTTTCWAFYLLLLWAYDESFLGVYSIATKGILVASIAGTIYYVYRLNQQTGWGTAIRYAVGAMIVAWTPVEILGKWGAFKQPWLLIQPSMLLLFFGGLAIGTWALWRAAQRRRELIQLAQESSPQGEAQPAGPSPQALA